MEELKGLIQGKTIKVKDTDLTNGQNTHFIANIDLATTFFEFMNENATGWRSMELWEGYRSRKEQNIQGERSSLHSQNNAIDFGNVIGPNGVISPDMLWAKAWHSENFFEGELKTSGLHLSVGKDWEIHTKYGNKIANRKWWFEDKIDMDHWQKRWGVSNLYMDRYFDSNKRKLEKDNEEEFMSILMSEKSMQSIYLEEVFYMWGNYNSF